MGIELMRFQSFSYNAARRGRQHPWGVDDHSEPEHAVPAEASMSATVLAS